MTLCTHRLGQQQVRFDGSYNNKIRRIYNKKLRAKLHFNPVAASTQQQLWFSMAWAALFKLVYEAAH
jgi:hypothetical protein